MLQLFGREFTAISVRVRRCNHTEERARLGTILPPSATLAASVSMLFFTTGRLARYSVLIVP